MESNNNTIIGIDLGTTNSCVGIWKNNKVEILTNEHGSKTTPSVVFYNNNKQSVVGEFAMQRLIKYPKQTIYGVKRIIGRKLNTFENNFNFDLKIGKNGKIFIELPTVGQLYPEEVSSEVLKKMKQIAELHTNSKITDAVITIPAYFDDDQRNATKNAAKIAGINVIRMINEPTAACLCYGLDKLESNQNVIVFDLGGGTLDISLLNINDGMFEVIGTNGDCQLGGDDFDQILVDHWIEKYEWNLNYSQKNKLRIACENIKKQLSQSIIGQYILDDFIDNEDIVLEIDLDEWDRLTNPLICKCRQLIEQLLITTNYTTEQIDQVVLVGGSSRIKSIKTMLSSVFNNIIINQSVNPDEAIAYGAAIQAAIISNQTDAVDEKLNKMVLIDVTPLSLGIETTGGLMSIIVPRNSSIPCTETSYFTTIDNYQTEVEIKVYQGERTLTSDCKLIGTFSLNGIPPALRGIPKIKVTFKIDANGIINVSAVDEVSNIYQNITFESDSGRLSEDEVDRIIKEAEINKTIDIRKTELIEKRKKIRDTLEDLDRVCLLPVDSDKTESSKIRLTISEIKQKLLDNEQINLTNLDMFDDNLVKCQNQIDTTLIPEINKFISTNKNNINEEENTFTSSEINSFLSDYFNDSVKN